VENEVQSVHFFEVEERKNLVEPEDLRVRSDVKLSLYILKCMISDRPRLPESERKG